LESLLIREAEREHKIKCQTRKEKRMWRKNIMLWWGKSRLEQADYSSSRSAGINEIDLDKRKTRKVTGLQKDPLGPIRKTMTI